MVDEEVEQSGDDVPGAVSGGSEGELRFVLIVGSDSFAGVSRSKDSLDPYFS